MFELDFNSEKPIYLQLYEEIIIGISKKELHYGQSLPSVRAMAEEIGINLHTVNKTYNLLKEEGYIAMDRRKGAIINPFPIEVKDTQHEEWTHTLKLLAAKSILQGMDEKTFLDSCKMAYKQTGGE